MHHKIFKRKLILIFALIGVLCFISQGFGKKYFISNLDDIDLSNLTDPDYKKALKEFMDNLETEQDKKDFLIDLGRKAQFSFEAVVKNLTDDQKAELMISSWTDALRHSFIMLSKQDISAKLAQMLEKMQDNVLDFVDFMDLIALTRISGDPEVSIKVVSLMRIAFKEIPALSSFTEVLWVIVDPEIADNTTRAKIALEKLENFKRQAIKEGYTEEDLKRLNNLGKVIASVILNEFDYWLAFLTSRQIASLVGNIDLARAAYALQNSIRQYMVESEEEVRNAFFASDEDSPPFVPFDKYYQYLGNKIEENKDRCAEIIFPDESIRAVSRRQGVLYRKVERQIETTLLITGRSPLYGISDYLSNDCKYLAIRKAFQYDDSVFFPHLKVLKRWSETDDPKEKQSILLDYALTKKHTSEKVSLSLISMLDEDTLPTQASRSEMQTAQWHWNDIVGRKNPGERFNMPERWKAELAILAASGFSAGLGKNLVKYYAIKYVPKNILVKFMLYSATPFLLGTVPAWDITHRGLSWAFLQKPFYGSFGDAAYSYRNSAIFLLIFEGAGIVGKLGNKALFASAPKFVQAGSGAAIQTLTGAGLITGIEMMNMEIFVKDKLSADEKAHFDGKGPDGYFLSQGYIETFYESLISLAAIAAGGLIYKAADAKTFRLEEKIEMQMNQISVGISSGRVRLKGPAGERSAPTEPAVIIKRDVVRGEGSGPGDRGAPKEPSVVVRKKNSPRSEVVEKPVDPLEAKEAELQELRDLPYLEKDAMVADKMRRLENQIRELELKKKAAQKPVERVSTEAFKVKIQEIEMGNRIGKLRNIRETVSKGLREGKSFEEISKELFGEEVQYKSESEYKNHIEQETRKLVEEVENIVTEADNTFTNMVDVLRMRLNAVEAKKLANRIEGDTGAKTKEACSNEESLLLKEGTETLDLLRNVEHNQMVDEYNALNKPRQKFLHTKKQQERLSELETELKRHPKKFEKYDVPEEPLHVIYENEAKGLRERLSVERKELDKLTKEREGDGPKRESTILDTLIEAANARIAKLEGKIGEIDPARIRAEKEVGTPGNRAQEVPVEKPVVEAKAKDTGPKRPNVKVKTWRLEKIRELKDAQIEGEMTKLNNRIEKIDTKGFQKTTEQLLGIRNLKIELGKFKRVRAERIEKRAQTLSKKTIKELQTEISATRNKMKTASEKESLILQRKLEALRRAIDIRRANK